MADSYRRPDPENPRRRQTRSGNSTRPTTPRTVSSRPASTGRTLRSSAKIDMIREQGRAGKEQPPTRDTRTSDSMQRIKRQAKPRTLTERPEPNARVAARAKHDVSEASASTRRSRQQNRTAATGLRSRSTAESASFGQQRMAQGVWTKESSRRSSRPSASQTARNSTAMPRNARGGAAVLSRTAQSRRPWPVLLIVILVAVLLIAGGVDALVNGNRIYSGVTIGDVDVSGMTKEEASNLVSSTYSQRVAENTVVFYANEDAQANPQTSDVDENIEEQISYEQSLSDRTQWTVPANQVEASIDVDALVNEAYEVGRSTGSIIGRLQALIGGWAVNLTCTYNDSLVEELASQMTAAVGTARVNYNVAISEGSAYVTDGNEGDEVTYDWLVSNLNSTYLGTETSVSRILETEHLELQITEETAQEVADSINASIASGAIFSYEDQTWQATRTDLASWITTEIEEEGSGWVLKLLFSEDTAKGSLLSQLHSNVNQENLTVSFDKAEDGSITVTTNATGTVPLVSDAITNMNNSFFVSDSRSEAPTIEVSSTDLPSSLSLSDAQAYGIVSEVSSYTTQYSSGASARVNNIHTAANYITYSIAKADGGQWSYNDTAGDATEERGYQNAGAIVSGTYTDAIGGGICQVATTVFNCVYEAGYPIVKRYNHSLRISTYPDGRDAAVAYPSLDLVWENDTSSDVLLVMSYTDSSVTATLLGVDPGYQVTTEYGEWEEGDAYTTTYTYDDTLAEGTQYVETTGVNGSSITIVRTVTDSSGNVISEDTFTSTYKPKNEVIVVGSAS